MATGGIRKEPLYNEGSPRRREADGGRASCLDALQPALSALAGHGERRRGGRGWGHRVKCLHGLRLHEVPTSFRVARELAGLGVDIRVCGIEREDNSVTFVFFSPIRFVSFCSVSFRSVPCCFGSVRSGPVRFVFCFVP